MKNFSRSSRFVQRRLHAKFSTINLAGMNVSLSFMALMPPNFGDTHRQAVYSWIFEEEVSVYSRSPLLNNCNHMHIDTLARCVF